MPAARSPANWLVPNGLSILRMALGIAFPWLPERFRLATVLVAALSDAFDGFAARRLHAESDTGQLLDPIADRTFVLLVAGTLVAMLFGRPLIELYWKWMMLPPLALPWD